MEYRQFSSKFFVRIDRGEEIVGSLKQLAAQQKITLASVSALGAVGSFTVGVYKVEEKKYYSNSFETLKLYPLPAQSPRWTAKLTRTCT